MKIGDLVFCDDERCGTFFYGIITGVDPNQGPDWDGKHYTAYTIHWSDGDVTVENDEDLELPETYKGYVDEWTK